MSRRRRTSAVLALCVLLSGAYHVGLTAGLVLLLDDDGPPEREPTEPTITYLELDELPEPLDPAREPEDEAKRKRPELEFDELPEPEDEPEPREPEPEPEPEPPPEEQLPPEHFVLEQLKMVEQPDELDEAQAPDDVEYLSNINRDVQEQTRAEVTNLEQDALEQQAQQLEDSQDDTVGTADEQRIAENRDIESARDRQAPQSRPEREAQPAEQQDPKPQSLLAMRNLERREHRAAQEQREALAETSDDGSLLPEQDQQASIAPQDQQARSEQPNKHYKFRLSQRDLDARFGRDIDAKARMLAKRQSKTKGVWEEARKRWQSPLENMVPEVQVGNQTALRSRKHPFARYIAQMHRKIHDAWAWGYLSMLDSQGRGHPLNDHSLWTNVEIVLNGDGTIDKVTTIHFSGQSAFDAAAREHVYAAGPFPDPPRSILSGNGKIYMHWRFHRNERACGTFGAEPYILDNAGHGDRPNPHLDVQPGKRAVRRLQREQRHAHAGHTLRARQPAPAVPEGPQPAPPADDAAAHQANHHARNGARNGRAERAVHDGEARDAANKWLAYFSKGDMGKAAARSTLPFYAGDDIVARSQQELGSILTHMAAEANAGGRASAAKIFTAAQLRRLYGGLPQGVREGEGRLYGLAKLGGEQVILFLERKFGVWRVAGWGR